MLYPSSLLRTLQKFMLLKTSLRMQLPSLSSINYMFIKRSRQEVRKKYKNKIIKFYERGSFWWANVLQRYSPWNVDIGQVQWRKIFEKGPAEKLWGIYGVKMSFSGFGVNNLKDLKRMKVFTMLKFTDQI